MKTIEQLRVHRVAFLTFVLEVRRGKHRRRAGHTAAARWRARAGAPCCRPTRRRAGHTCAAGCWPARRRRACFRPADCRRRRLLIRRRAKDLGPAAPCPICAVDGSCCASAGPAAAAASRAGRTPASSPGRPTPRANTSATPAPRTFPNTASASTTSWTCSIASRATRRARPYQLNVGDAVRVESFTDPDLNRELDRPARRHDHRAASGPGPRRRAAR